MMWGNASEDENADTDKNENDDDDSDDDDDTADGDDGDIDQVHGVRTQNGRVQVRVCLLSCAEEVCFKNVNAALLQNQNYAFRFSLATKW